MALRAGVQGRDGTVAAPVQLSARIAKAQELLLSRSMPHAQIALEVGFAEQSHLCRVFKNMTGVSPAAWLRDRWTRRKGGL